jgi:hypothetical protein
LHPVIGFHVHLAHSMLLLIRLVRLNVFFDCDILFMGIAVAPFRIVV